MIKAIILTFILLTSGLTTTLAQVANTNEPCSLEAWIEDKDPNGTNIRDLPGLNGKIIAVIPHAKEPSDEAMLSVIGYSNGWLKVNAVGNVDETFTFDKIGWISARKVGAVVETPTNKPAVLYALPKLTSKKVGTIPNEELINIVGFDCFGYKVSYKKIAGWIKADDVCGNVLTTCP